MSIGNVGQAGAPWSVKEPSIRGVAALGTAGTSGTLIAANTAGGATLTFSDGSTMAVFMQAGTTYLRAVITSVVPGAVAGTLVSLGLAAGSAKGTIES